jgi:hypothetical protein
LENFKVRLSLPKGGANLAEQRHEEDHATKAEVQTTKLNKMPVPEDESGASEFAEEWADNRDNRPADPSAP